MLVVGLTGGIGSGKSTVAARFAELGAGVIDADELSHELTAAGQPTLKLIAETFGKHLLRTDGTLDRAALRQLVFQDAAAKTRLESILHPRIKDAMRARMQRLETPYAVLVIPLLFESGQETLTNRVLVVDAPEDVQIARVMTRSGLSRTDVERIMATQISRHARLARADDVIDNAGPPGDLEAQIQRLHAIYLAEARGL